MEQEKVNTEKEKNGSVGSITKEEKTELESRRTGSGSRNSTGDIESQHDSDSKTDKEAGEVASNEERPVLDSGTSIPSTIGSNTSGPTIHSGISTRPATTAETSAASSGWENPAVAGTLNAYSYDLRVKLFKSLGVENISRIDIADNNLLERFFSLHTEREQKEIEKLRAQNLERLDNITDKFIKSEKFSNETLSKLLDILSTKGMESVDALGSPSLRTKRSEQSPTRLMSPRGHKRYKSEIPTLHENDYAKGQSIAMQQQPNLMYQQFQVQPHMMQQQYYMQQQQQQGQQQQGQQQGQQGQMWPPANVYQQPASMPVAFHAPSLPASQSESTEEINPQVTSNNESNVRSRQQSVSSAQQGLSNSNSGSSVAISGKAQSSGDTSTGGKEQGTVAGRQYMGSQNSGNMQFTAPTVTNPGYVSYQTTRGPYVVVPQGGQNIQPGQYVGTSGAAYYQPGQPNVGGMLQTSQGYQFNPSLASNGAPGSNSMLPSVQYRGQAGESFAGQAHQLSLSSSTTTKKAQGG